MDYLQKFITQFRDRLIVLLLINNLIILADWWLADQVFKLAGWWLLVALLGVPLLSLSFLPWLSTRYLTQPTKLLWQAILHLLPDSHNIPAPKLQNVRFGSDLVQHLANNVYQLAIDGARIAAASEEDAHDLRHNELANRLPVPLLVLNTDSNITFANAMALQYLGAAENDVVDKPFYSLFDLLFTDGDTFDSWLKGVRSNAVTASATWQHVRSTLPSKKTVQFDLAANYSRDDPRGHEVVVAIFDRTAAYEQEDQGLNFIAVAVHELRTPLSLLLGYVELFEEELGDKLDPELKRFMLQMKSAGQNLATFVSTILTVARIENNQLELELTEENWGKIVTQAVDEMRLRARVYGIALELTIDQGLPPVGANPVTATEVIINLIDNAIKYSQQASDKKIIIHAGLNAEGLVETTVQDFGIGIPTSIISNLFERFYRNFRNRVKINGTGLGLYLSRLIVEAHGGHIWVRSQEGKGATFGFTVQPYTMLASELKNGNNTDIIHSAHGWVKNHSLYRR